MGSRQWRFATLTVVALLAASTAWGGPLHDVAENGDIGAVKRLIATGADVNIRDDYDLTPLRAATLEGHREIVELLTPHGAKPQWSI